MSEPGNREPFSQKLKLFVEKKIVRIGIAFRGVITLVHISGNSQRMLHQWTPRHALVNHMGCGLIFKTGHAFIKLPAWSQPHLKIFNSFIHARHRRLGSSVGPCCLQHSGFALSRIDPMPFD